MKVKIQTALSVVFPPRCVGCGAMVETDFALCGSCWGETPLIAGLVCDACGIPIPGQPDAAPTLCDACMATPRPWSAGRSALLYKDQAKQMVLSLKHGGRLEIARAAAIWLERSAQDLLQRDTLIVPVPLHWTRLFKRTFNQSAVLAQELARRTGHAICPDALIRSKRTQSLDTKSKDERFAMLEGAIRVHPKRTKLVQKRPVLLIDDVMTSGATLAAATQACLDAGSADVCVLTLARVAKDT